jgi:hypothetical protein
MRFAGKKKQNFEEGRTVAPQSTGDPVTIQNNKNVAAADTADSGSRLSITWLSTEIMKALPTYMYFGVCLQRPCAQLGVVLVGSLNRRGILRADA